MSRTSSLRRALALAAWVGCARVAAAQVTVLDPWVRGTVEGQPSTAAYLTLRSDSAVRLVSVTSPVAARCSVHEMSISGTLMRMRTIESLAIPAGGAVELARRSMCGPRSLRSERPAPVHRFVRRR